MYYCKTHINSDRVLNLSIPFCRSVLFGQVFKTKIKISIKKKLIENNNLRATFFFFLLTIKINNYYLFNLLFCAILVTCHVVIS